jgi:hypothetical protein
MARSVVGEGRPAMTMNGSAGGRRGWASDGRVGGGRSTPTCGQEGERAPSSLLRAAVLLRCGSGRWVQRQRHGGVARGVCETSEQAGAGGRTHMDKVWITAGPS